MRNAEVGRAIDLYDLGGDSVGLRLLENALTPSRNLTHRQARIVTVGFALSEPAWRSQKEEPGSALWLELVQAEKGAFAALAALLYEAGAWRDPRREIPAFIPLDVIDKLAERLADDAGAPGRSRTALATSLRRSLREMAPPMARSWCDVAARTRIARTIPGAPDLIEGVARVGFGDRYIAPGRLAAAFGAEFEILHRKRPELTQGMVMPNRDPVAPLNGEHRERVREHRERVLQMLSDATEGEEAGAAIISAIAEAKPDHATSREPQVESSTEQEVAAPHMVATDERLEGIEY